ncbi:hypothetical protein CH373_17010 [Leptospira perolatii]|uniref:Alpha/beta hydrolase n=1 Tax=Leptospira perolatii TaxID=2023191 RepID=A0A2M9ZIU0_9LEPT|nr:alpha/beta hydrolase [Leptospira perolatii]PJZ68153.1 hypothetical protein CH360_17580 [Leptospira perolatii]PJZ71931.1 hypothetical protein CH373_17010 [Leptospira perolatii]
MKLSPLSENRFRQLIRFAVLLCFLFYFSCSKTVGELLETRISNSYANTQSLEIMFSTTRATNSNSQVACSNAYFMVFGNQTSKTGSCIVNVPVDHTVGAIPFGLGNREKLFQFLDHRISPDGSEEANWWKKVESDASQEILIFVHGFNVGFEEAILRAAQIQFDLKFPGRMIAYSWPAGGDVGVLSQLMLKSTYEKNLVSAQSSRESFKNFLRRISKTDKKLHLIVHSMGHQVVLPAIAELAKESGSPLLKELILNAPDFDTGEFIMLMDALKKSAERITLYCSPGDSALIASSQIHQTGRLGTCSKFPGVDVINVNPIDSSIISLGHGYYSSRPILTDLYQLLLGMSAEKRLFIRKSLGNENYVLRN